MITIPKEYKEIERETRNNPGFMGLSVGKKIFENKKIMSQYAEFMNDHFSNSFFLIADLPKRYNLIAIEGINENSALRRVLMAGNNMERFLQKIVKPFSRVGIKRYSELQSKEYEDNLEVLRQAYENNPDFRSECDKAVFEFLSLPQNRRKILERKNLFKDSLRLATNYKIDELALLLAMPLKTNNLCEIYPGKDNLHERVQNNEFDFCRALKMNPTRRFMEVYCKDGN